MTLKNLPRAGRLSVSCVSVLLILVAGLSAQEQTAIPEQLMLNYALQLAMKNNPVL